MAGARGILNAVTKSTWRDVQQTGSISGNHFFLVSIFLLRNGGFLALLAAVLLLFPLSADPMAKIPKERRALWPLSPAQHVRLRVACLLLSPILWIFAGLLLLNRSPSLGLAILALAVAFHGAAALFARWPQRVPGCGLLFLVPPFPGSLGLLVRKNLREMLWSLDTWLALLVALVGTGYRVAVAEPEPKAVLFFSLFTALALSSYAQCVFALDWEEGRVRYGVLPLRGWQVLAAKDIAIMTILLVMVLPLAPLPGIAAGLAMLAVGHKFSVRPNPQVRWRFNSGAALISGFWQIPVLVAAGAITFHTSPLAVAPCAAAYVLSLFHYGRRFERAVQD